MLLRQLPSVIRFAERVLSDLLQGRSVLILIPCGIAADDLWSWIEEELRSRGCRARWLDPEDLQTSDSDLHAMWRWVKAPGELVPPEDWMDLIQRPDWPEALRIRGMERLSMHEQIRWIQLITCWAEARKRMTSSPPGPRSLWAVIPATLPPDHIPSNDIFLQVHRWWGFPSNLEIRWLCREHGFLDMAEALWAEHVSAGLAGSDPSLALQLRDVVFDPLENLYQHLVEIAVKRGWTAEECREWLEQIGADALPVFMETIPDPLYPIWARGALLWTPEYGLELHPAVLAQAGDFSNLQRRLVRAQATLIWPVLVEIHKILVNKLGISENHEGHMEWKSLSDQVRGTSLEAEINRARLIRNMIAHLRPISWPEFHFLWSFYQRLTRP